jgi:glycosyltransferase involved in cell wall biosynthesis
MELTVAICTRNRCAALRRALASLAGVAVPDGVSWELVVADNASEDATAATITEFSNTLPLHAIVVSEVGKSNALKAVIDVASGEYILWLDDDVLVDPGWMTAYHDAFLRFPEAAFFGGPITPVFEGARPSWLDGAMHHVANAYAARDLGAEMIRLEGEALPYGANWAIRASEQRRHRYDPRLGPRGEQRLVGEEWAVMHALLDDGAAGRWVPAARVQHVIPPARQSLGYLRRYYRGNGASWAIVRQTRGEPMLLGRPRWVWREAFEQEIAFRIRRLYAAPEVWSEHLRRSSVAWGMLTGRAD